METSCLYLVLHDQEIFAAQVSCHDGEDLVVQDVCKTEYTAWDMPFQPSQPSQPSQEAQPQDAPSQEEDQTEKNPGAPSGIADALDRIAEHMDISSCSSAVVFFPTHWVSFRTLCLPFETPRKIRQILDFELEGMLPVEEESHVTDFYSLGKQKDCFRIFTASIPESRQKPFVDAVKALGLSVKFAAPLASGAAQGFINSPLGQDHALLVMEEGNYLVFVLIWKGRVHCVRSRPYSRNPDPVMVKAHVQQMLAGACQEFGLDRTLPVFLCMDISQDSETAQTMQSVLTQMPETDRIEFCQDLDSWPISLDGDKSHPYMAQFIKNRNFRFFALGKYGAGLGICAFLLGAVLGMYFLGAVLENAFYTRKIQSLDAQAKTIFLETFPNTSRVQDPYLQMKANVGAALKEKGDFSLAGVSFSSTQILTELSRKIAPSIDVVISHFLLREGKLILVGATDDFHNVDKIKTSLESSVLFQKVEITSASADKEDNRVHFRFMIDI